MISAILRSATGRRYAARVTKDGGLLSSILPYPALLPQLTRPYNGYLVDSNGSEDMSGAVGTPTNPVIFSISADNNSDRYLTELSFEMGYGNGLVAYLYVFADGTALTNGLSLYYESIYGARQISQPIKSNSDLLRLRREPLTTDWQSRNFAAANDWGYLGTIDLAAIMPPYGIKLDRGTRQRLIVAVQDDISGPVDLLNFRARGFERFEQGGD